MSTSVPNQQQQFIKMTEHSIPKLILSLSIPTVISMLSTSIYNMADTFFVSQLGTSATAAVGIVFSIMAIIQSIGFTLGMGAGSIISRLLGQQDRESACITASTAFFAALVAGVLIAICGQIWIEPLMQLLGATDTVLPYATSYATYIFWGAPFICASFVMNNILRSEGKATFSMIALASGGLINILLDPFFIFVLDLGTAGAAIATLISQFIGFCIFIQFFFRKKSIVHLSYKYISPRFRVYRSIVSNGFPSLCRQGLASISTVLLNVQAAAFGDAAIAGMSIVTRIVMMVASVMVGVGQGFTPVSGYNYGAKNYKRVRKAYWFTMFLGFCFLSVSAITLYLFAPQLIAFFRDDLDVIATGTRALRFQAITLPLHAIIVSTNMLMQSTGKIKQATFLACNRQGVFLLPLLAILPSLLGLTGVEIAQAGADFFSFLMAIPYIIWFMKRW